MTDLIEGLRKGDFSRLEPAFEERSGGRPQVVELHAEGRFDDDPEALAEALTCACFLGKTSVAEYFLARGVDPGAGAATGVDALHWAASRGLPEMVRLLLRHKAPLESRNRFGGTTLGMAVWSAIHEPMGDQLQVIDELLAAGARVEEVKLTGNTAVDAILRRYGVSDNLSV
jgi:ankyrin repeat protein